MMNAILDKWNRTAFDEAVQEILPCNGSLAWATAMVKERHFATAETLFAMSDVVWGSLTEIDWQAAFDSHPRIGERHAHATSQSLQWSAEEQAAAEIDAATQLLLFTANQEYEGKFGRLFIVCANEKTAKEMLAILDRRLQNDQAMELQEAVEQQRQITQLRLRKWLGTS